MFFGILKEWKEEIKKRHITSATRPSAAAVVFGGHLSAQAAFRLDIRRLADAIRTCV